MLDRLRPLRDLLWPASCAACGAAGQTLCPCCAAGVAGAAQVRWHTPTPSPPGFPPTLAWGDYGGPLRRLVVAHKDHGRTDVAGVLAALLAEAVEVALDGLETPVLVPVPSSPAARRVRGYEPLLDLTRCLRLARQVPVVPALRVAVRVRDQAGLDADARRANLAGSLALVAGADRLLEGTDIVLIDDVVTTGSTLAEAVRALQVGCAEEDGDASGAGRGAVATVRSAVICATRRWI